MQIHKVFPGGSVVKNPPVNAGNTGDMGLIPGSGRSPGEGNGNTIVFLPGKPHGQRRLAFYSPRGHTRVRQDWATEQAHVDKDMNIVIDMVMDTDTAHNCKTVTWSMCYSLLFSGWGACTVLVLQPGIEPVPPAVEPWSLNHWTTREVLLLFSSLPYSSKFVTLTYSKKH